MVHSFSRFFRDHFELEFYVRKLAKNGVKLVSITQETGDDPMHVMMRQIMALFDEYQSKENAKHVLRAMSENARQGVWNGALPPIGYRIVAAEQRGAKIKKKLEIDPLHADTVRLIYRLFLEGDGVKGPMGVKPITCYLNERRLLPAMAAAGGWLRSIRVSTARPTSASTGLTPVRTRTGRRSPRTRWRSWSARRSSTGKPSTRCRPGSKPAIPVWPRRASPAAPPSLPASASAPNAGAR